MALVDGAKAVTVAGTAERLSATSVAVRGLEVQALAANTGAVFVGGPDIAAGRGVALDAGERVELPHVDDLSHVFVDAATSGEGVSFVAVAL